MQRTLIVTMIATMAALVGCSGSDGTQLYEVSGTVSYDGKPIKHGEIIFVPDTSKGNSGAGGYADVKDGKFKTKYQKGVVGGPYLLTISGRPNLGAGEDEAEAVYATGGSKYMLFPVQQLPYDLPKSDTTLEIDIPAQ